MKRIFLNITLASIITLVAYIALYAVWGAILSGLENSTLRMLIIALMTTLAFGFFLVYTSKIRKSIGEDEVVSDYKDSFNADTTVFFEKLAYASEVILADGCDDETAVSIVTDSAKLFIPMAEIIDIEKEKARLEKERQTALSEIDRVNKELSNESFVAKAPAAVIDGEKAKLAKYSEMLSNIEEMISKLAK